MKKLQGGPFNGVQVPGQKEDDLWITVYSLNRNRWEPAPGTFCKNFPAGVIRHSYRKQKDSQFHFIWSKPNDDED